MSERDPRHAGNGVGIGGRYFAGAGQDAVTPTKLLLMLDVGIVEGGKVVIVFGPKQGESLVILMEDSIKGREGVVIADLSVDFGDFKGLLFVEQAGDQSQIGREELEAVFF